MSALVAEGYSSAREVTRRHGKSFYFVSAALPGARKNAAYALYAYLRRLDDWVDGDTATLETNEAELAALQDAQRRFGIPAQPMEDMYVGLSTDRVKNRYASFAELETYCYCVAGTVGLMMSAIFGAPPRAFPAAVALGKAMQLTNILRDVREDWQRGRLYLPRDELQSFGITEADIASGQMSAQWRSFVRFQIFRARRWQEEAMRGVAEIPSPVVRWCVRAMGAIYCDILRVIERRDYDVFASRAVVSTPRKLYLMVRSLV